MSAGFDVLLSGQELDSVQMFERKIPCLVWSKIAWWEKEKTRDCSPEPHRYSGGRGNP